MGQKSLKDILSAQGNSSVWHRDGGRRWQGGEGLDFFVSDCGKERRGGTSPLI
jgi:hypothetical protein